MCQLFIGADNALWQSKTKSLRIDGVATSIRIENFFWSTLEEIAFRDQMTVNQLITKLYFEAMDADHDLGNFTSFLRVCCARYLNLTADGALERDLTQPLGNIAADRILQQERHMQEARQRQIGQHDIPYLRH
ncbi:ribbon-helix-helix domain-containing protein [Falsihalocynthiibacter sp. SS001]|uniref:ribbon-helix-helix domain-containing protein n=1 Tax=Falsihalocynthiibacter sp. SS001 TaxID=3349698 RepID=UPI0036D43120